MTKPMWMVRAEGGSLFEKFSEGVVAVGWSEIGDLSKTGVREDVRGRYETVYPEDGAGKTANGVGVLHKFRSTLRIGHKIVTYDPENRQYLVGDIKSDYRFSPSEVGPEWPHVRDVAWSGAVSRDQLSPATRNTLGSTLTLFAINADASAELLRSLAGASELVEDAVQKAKEERSTFREDELAKSHELIKDAIVGLDDREAEELVSALLRAMGYRSRVTAPGPDRGVDVVASPDGLGLQEPRIKAEVKHRPRSAMGAPEVRSFLALLRQGDRGVYVSTGGFTREARYEAERSPVPLALVTLDDLASLIVAHYEDFDVPGRVLLPLFRIYLPGE